MSLDYKRIARLVKSAELIITPRYEMWQSGHEAFPLPPDLADKVRDLLAEPLRDRRASFSASASGRCPRAQIYSYLGVGGTQRALDPKMATIFANGTWSHLRLQCAFLMAGILDDIEYPLTWHRRRTRGTMDGIGTVPENHPNTKWRGLTFGCEIKTANEQVFQGLVHDGPGKYTRQVTRYFVMSGVDLFVIFAESKHYHTTLEWVIEPDPILVEADKRELDMLNDAVDNRALPDRLPACRGLSGETYRNCDFGRGKTAPCARLTSYESAEKEANQRP